MPDTFNLAQVVTNLLTQVGKTQTELEKKLGKRDFIGQLLRGDKKTVSEKNLVQLAQVLNVDLACLTPAMSAPPPKSANGQRGYIGRTRARYSADKVNSPTDESEVPAAEQADDDQSFLGEGFDGMNEEFARPPMALVYNRPLQEVLWAAEAKRGRDGDVQQKQSADGVIRTALPIFQLKGREGRLFLDFADKEWQPRPHSLVGVPGAYGVLLPFSVYPHLKAGAIIILEPGKSLRGGDWVLRLQSANVEHQHEVDLQIVRNINSGGVILRPLNTPGVPTKHADQSYYRVHRVHSIQL